MLEWTTYSLRLHVPGPLYGGIPRDPDMIERWLKAAEIDSPELAAETEEAVEPIPHDQRVAGMWCGFKRDGNLGLYIEARQIKAALKDAANVLQAALGQKNLKAKLAARVFVAPERIFLGKAEPAAFEERAIHVMTRLGPRDALKRADYVLNTTITCDLRVLGDGVISEKMLRDIIEYTAIVGIGADRSQGGGRVTEWELVVEQPPSKAAKGG